MKSQDLLEIDEYLTLRRWPRPALDAVGNFGLTLAILALMHLRSRYESIPWGLLIPLAALMSLGRFAIVGIDIRLRRASRVRLHRAGVWMVRLSVVLTAIQLLRAFVPR